MCIFLRKLYCSSPLTLHVRFFFFPNLELGCSKLLYNHVSFVSEQGWKAFEDTIGHLPLEGNKQDCELQLETQSLSSSADRYFGFRELEVCTFKAVFGK